MRTMIITTKDLSKLTVDPVCRPEHVRGVGSAPTVWEIFGFDLFLETPHFHE